MTTTVNSAALSEAQAPALPKSASVDVQPKEVVTEQAVKKVDPVEVDTRSDRAMSMEDVQKAVEQLRAAVDDFTPSLNIGFDGELNKMIVRVRDAETNELIRELPPEDVLEIARFLERNGWDAVGSESLKGMLLDDYG